MKTKRQGQMILRLVFFSECDIILKYDVMKNGKQKGAFMTVFLGLIIPFIGTTLGAVCVFFVKNELKPLIQKSLLGFAAGVMVAASVWSLLIPAMEMSKPMGRLAFLPAAVGFIIGILFLLILDRAIPHLHIGCEEAEG